MKQLAVSSFAYRYNIGFDGFASPRPLTAENFLRRAGDLGFQGVQICENLGIAKMSREELLRIKELARELGLFIEVGMNGAEKENLLLHREIAETLGSDFVRVVLGGKSRKTEAEAAEASKGFTYTIGSVLPLFKQSKIRIGMENHFDLPTRWLKAIADAVNDEYLGLILDTTNCIHFLERPEEALEICRGRIVSVHLKDYSVKKIEAGHCISGTVLLDGELSVQPFLDACDSIVMEMTIRRPEGFTADQILQWEDEAVAVSAGRLMDCVKR
ncbi:sugar phosphate isomerase/epimerase family protein [Breznakiella homolactica]|uniref:Sugar phosphate isomerase/epimerase n=1 Tax=Breznakiella homolactica TaxID=2798577 RepID=A0A7T7XKV8_9SPIR|nr:TIM barrel protein [Breznakiella homolactica]QQO08123.1 sugar phosphate isomerase/epimerase [Breznakiella homolactica]